MRWQNSFLIRRSACGASRHRRRCEVQGIGSELGRAPPRAHPQALAPHAQASRARRLLLRRDQEPIWWVLVHRNVVCFSRVCICAKLWREEAAVMLEERAGNVARCGQSKDVCSLCIGANDVGPCCCVVTHRGDLLQRVVGPAHDEAAHASNALGEAGNVVWMVLDLPTNVTCRVPAQRGLEGSHVGSVQRLAHGRGVGRHEDEPDVGMRLPMEGQELLADVHGTHVHEADPCGAAAIGVHDNGVQPCEGRRCRPMALRVGRGEQRWVTVEGFDGGSLALKNELGIHVGHEMPGVEEHGDVAARVHDDVLFASSEPPAFEQRQHLAARLMMRLRSVMPASFNVHSIFDLLLAQFSKCTRRCFGPFLPKLALGFLEGVPK